MLKNFRELMKTICIALLIPFFGVTSVAAQDPANAPQTQSWVTDQAGILSDSTEKALTKDARKFEAKTSSQFVVVTVTTLDGWTIERYGRWLGNKWGIGQSETDNGVLLLVAPNERKVRIEVGLGLEGILTDRMAQRIIDDEILPEFRSGDLEAGIVAGHRAVIAALTEEQIKEQQDQTLWERFLHFILLPFFLLGRLFGSDEDSLIDFSGGGGSFGGGGASGGW
jgi:uncharacterized protein